VGGGMVIAINYRMMATLEPFRREKIVRELRIIEEKDLNNPDFIF
jgi:hypothetical protein